MKKNRKLGFTLAEVLITLSIIGVVAALTIPALIQRTGDEEIVSKLNKAYSTLSQATEMILTEQGSAKTWASDANQVYQLYKTHLRNAKECSSSKGCFKNVSYKHLNGTNTGNFYALSTYEKLILADGVQVMFGDINKSCSGSWDGSAGICLNIRVDLNGNKEPNKVGRDMFEFVLKNNGLYPAGCDKTDYNCVTEDNGFGWGCACRVLQEGKIDY